MQLLDWREADQDLLSDIWTCQIDRWQDRLSWDSASNWAAVEAERRSGRLPGLILLDDSGVHGWTFFLVHHDTLQIGAFESASSAASRLLLDGALETVSSDIAPAGALLFAFSAAPGLVPALVARGFETEPYRYLVRDVSRVFPPSGQMAWTIDTTVQLPRLLADAYGEPRLTRPFVRHGSDSEWREYCAQLLASSACGTFDASLSTSSLAPDGSLDGAIVVTVVSPRTAHIAQVAVAPKARGRRLASAMMAEVLAKVAYAGFEQVSLLVSGRNARALRLYERAGFAERATFISAGRN
ncbi:MAG TPA: N-acetyltransferase [Gemmatimonadaceae bacterium]